MFFTIKGLLALHYYQTIKSKIIKYIYFTLKDYYSNEVKIRNFLKLQPLLKKNSFKNFIFGFNVSVSGSEIKSRDTPTPFHD